MNQNIETTTVDEIGLFSSAGPCQVRAVRVVHATPEEVFAVLARQEHMSQWVPMLAHVDAGLGACEAGATRVCTFGGQQLRETIVQWDPPRRYAYHADDTDDATDHLGIIDCQRRADGRTAVSWSQHFTPKRRMKGWAMRGMMKVVLSLALANLERRISAARKEAV